MKKVYIFSIILIFIFALSAYFLAMHMPKFFESSNSFDSSDSGQTIENKSYSSIENIKDDVPLSDIPVEAVLEPVEEVYKSKLNKRISFNVPQGSDITETGSQTDIKFIITEPNTKKYIMTFKKESGGCFDPLGSFSIQAGQGVDFRIIQKNNEIMLQEKIKTLQLFEMYGTYAGAIGFRANACIYSAVPTKIEIRTSSYGRYEGEEAYIEMDKIIKSLKV